MSRVIRIQTNFSSGEIDPLLRSRVDLKQYYNALQTATNVFILPQGGAKRRDGLKYLAEIPSAAAPENGVRLVPFEFSSEDSYMFALANQRIYIFRSGALVTNINSTGNDYLAVSSITSAMLSEIRFAQSADTIIFVHEDLVPLKIVRGASHSAWTLSNITFKNSPQYPFTLATSNPSATLTPSAVSGNITLTASGSVFTADHVGQYVNNTATFGRARIVSYTSATVVKAVTEVGFFATVAIPASSWELETGYEASWSASKGYPVSATFHEGRLFFGGSKSLPTTIWGSVVNDFFNFEKGESLDDQSIEATITTASLNQIVDIFSGRDLQIFTTGGEFYVPQESQNPITPSNMFVRTATRNGIKPGVPVAGLDSGTIFIQRKGKSINEMLFTDSELAYTTSAISMLSGHLLSTPVDLAIRRATSTEETDRLYIVNSGDGSLAVFSILRSQQVIAPSKFTTDGNFLSVGIDVDSVYTIVKRTINSVDKYYVEIFDSTLHTDSSFYSASASSTGAAAHLEAKTLDVIVDGNVQTDKTVASGSVTFDRASVTSYEIGIPYTLEIKTMPVEPRLQSGNIKGFKKRILEVNAEVYQSQAMTVNGQLVAFRQLGENFLDQSIAKFTGVKKVGPLLGFDDEGIITISQTAPLDLNVLALDYKISVGA